MARAYSYASSIDVAAMLPGFIVSASSRPSATQIAFHLEQVSNELDAILAGADYQTPVPTSATAALDVVRAWTTKGAAYRAAMAMPQGKESKHADAYGKEWTAILTGVETGRHELPDTPRSSAKLPRGGGDDTGPTFSRADQLR